MFQLNLGWVYFFLLATVCIYVRMPRSSCEDHAEYLFNGPLHYGGSFAGNVQSEKCLRRGCDLISSIPKASEKRILEKNYGIPQKKKENVFLFDNNFLQTPFFTHFNSVVQTILQIL